MLFGVHNHYNNNAGRIGNFNHPAGKLNFSFMPVRIADQGLVIFNLDCDLAFDKKLELAAHLDVALKREFGRGLSFATCALSDCTREEDLAPFYSYMKEINPDIVTIYATYKNSDGAWTISRHFVKELEEGRLMEYIVDQFGETASEVVEILRPSALDKAVPPQGWESFEEKLKEIFAAAQKAVSAPEAPSSSRKSVPPSFRPF